MKKLFRYAWGMCAVAVLLMSWMASANAQSREKYVISVKAGGVNYVNGDVMVRRKDGGREGRVLSKDDLEAGDVVTTGASGRMEMLLNPGSYLRVAENSEFELVSNSLDDLRLKLNRGSALIEATGSDDAEILMEVITPQTSTSIVKRGIYRFNVAPESTQVLVWKGRALVGKERTMVKEKRKVTIANGVTSEVAKLEKNERDTLDVWSKERAEYLAKANRKVYNDNVTTALSSFDSWSYVNSFSRFYGVWFFDPRTGFYSFVPWGYANWYSPYGFGYHNWIYGPWPVRTIRNQPTIVTGPNNNPNGPKRQQGQIGGNSQPPSVKTEQSAPPTKRVREPRLSTPPVYTPRPRSVTPPLVVPPGRKGGQ